MVQGGISGLDVEPQVFAAGNLSGTNTQPTRTAETGLIRVAARVRWVPELRRFAARSAAPSRRRRTAIGGATRGIDPGNHFPDRSYRNFSRLIIAAPGIHNPGVPAMTGHNDLSRLVTADGLAAPATLSRS